MEKEIQDFPGYTITDDGKVISYKFKEPRIMKTWYQKSGYENIKLCKNNQTYHFLIHRLVAEAFIPNPNNLPEVNHKNKDRADNRVENLEWCDYLYNNNYGTKPERLSKSMIGRPAWNKGKKMSEEQKAKMRGRTFSEEHIKHLCESARKRIRTEEEIQRWRTASLGRHHTEEAKQKMSEARKLYWEKKKSINNKKD